MVTPQHETRREFLKPGPAGPKATTETNLSRRGAAEKVVGTTYLPRVGDVVVALWRIDLSGPCLTRASAGDVRILHERRPAIQPSSRAHSSFSFPTLLPGAQEEIDSR